MNSSSLSTNKQGNPYLTSFSVIWNPGKQRTSIVNSAWIEGADQVNSASWKRGSHFSTRLPIKTSASYTTILHRTCKSSTSNYPKFLSKKREQSFNSCMEAFPVVISNHHFRNVVLSEQNWMPCFKIPCCLLPASTNPQKSLLIQEGIEAIELWWRHQLTALLEHVNFYTEQTFLNNLIQ